MNLVEQQEIFAKKYVDKYNDVFAAINAWAQDSRKLSKQYRGKLSNSEALSAALTGVLPYNIDKRKLVKDADSQYVSNYIREALTQIDDKDVKLSVLRSLDESRIEKNLVFVYLKNLSPAQRSRVRIICKLIWFNLYPQKGKYNG